MQSGASYASFQPWESRAVDSFGVHPHGGGGGGAGKNNLYFVEMLLLELANFSQSYSMSKISSGLKILYRVLVFQSQGKDAFIV